MRMLPASGADAPALPRVERGHPGASAQREYLRRKQNRAAGIRRRHPLIGGLMLVLCGEPQHEAAFRQGGRGEQSVAHSLERRTANGPAQIIHDRRMPRGYGNIDHLAVAPTGVYVIRRVLAGLDRADVPVHGVLCFTKADLPLFGGREIRGYRLRHPRATARRLNRKGPLTVAEIDSLVSNLATALPPA
jgi:hypothetical protein